MIDLEQFPPEMRDRVKEDISKHGEWMTNYSIYLAPLWKMISELKEEDPDLFWLATVLHMINFFSSKDPSPVHFVTAREVLSKKEISDNRAVDALSRELVTACQKLQKAVLGACSDEENGFPLPIQQEGAHLLLNKDDLPDFICEREECNTADFIFAEFLKTSGKIGKKAAASVLADSKKRHQIFKNSRFQNEYRPIAWDLWVNKKEMNSSTFSPFLSILADVVWEDVCSSLWARESKNVPALTYGVHPSVAKILSHRIEAKEIDSQLHILHEKKIIANLPTIDPKLIPAVTKGINNLNSLYHHKLIRFECRAGFENWVSGKPDVRLLRFERGCSEIAERIGLKNNKSIEEIKNILHAQAHLQFHFDDGSNGNLIVLSKFRSSLSGREDGIMITLGPQLLPHYTFQTSRRERLLIPVPDLPPLISSSNSHASQAALQMLVMQKFADHSVELAELGSVEITETMWHDMAKESGLPPSIFKQALDRWLSDGDDGPRFLVEIEINRYALGPAYQKEENFLKEQGILRKQRQKDGEKSAYSKKKKLSK
jgi:hypothetical protein